MLPKYYNKPLFVFISKCFNVIIKRKNFSGKINIIQRSVFRKKEVNDDENKHILSEKENKVLSTLRNGNLGRI